jgi:hypothetical protein
MTWESAAIGLFNDAIKSLFGRLGDSLDEQRAAALVSEAARELLLVNPDIEKIMANIREAEALLKTPSVALLRVQALLDLFLRNQESAHSALKRMHEAYELAQTYLLSAITDLELTNLRAAAESVRWAVQICETMGDQRSLAQALVYTIIVAINGHDFDAARNALSDLLLSLRGLRDPDDEATIIGDLAPPAYEVNLKTLALHFLVASWVVQNDMRTWERIEHLSTEIGLNKKRLKEIIHEMNAAYAKERDSDLATIVFRDIERRENA